MTDLLGLAVAVMAVLTLALVGLVFAAGDQRQRDRQRATFRVHFPAQLEGRSVLDFVRSLSALRGATTFQRGRPAVVFETISASDGLEHRMRVPRSRRDFVVGQLRAAVPAIGIEPLESQTTATKVTVARSWGLRNGDRPLRMDLPGSVAAALLSALRPVHPGECVVVQWVVAPSRTPRPTVERPRRALVPISGRSLWLSALFRGAARTGAIRERSQKVSEPVFAATLRIGAKAKTARRASSLASRAGAALRIVERPGVGFSVQPRPARWVARWANTAATPVAGFPCHLNAAELSTVLGWPVGSPAVPGLRLGASRRLEVPPGVPSRGRVLRTSNAYGSNRPVAITAADGLHHLWVCGPTGVGKSTLLCNLAVQDVAAGRSLVMIDPKGSLVDDLLDRIPSDRRRDVIVLDVGDDSRPVGLNLLAGSEDDPELVADVVVGLLHGIYHSAWGPRTADVFHAAILSLCHTPGMTLAEVPALLTQDAFRQQVTARLNDPTLLGFWSWYSALSPAGRAEVVGPVMNKVRPALLRKRVRNVIGQAAPAWNMADVLNRQGILLVNLSKGQLGSEAAALVGSLVVGLVWQAIQARAIRLPASVIIDEFQDVVHLPTDLGDVLAQARGFGVGLTLAHQHTGQLDPRMLRAVLANARSKLCFQTAADDASVLAKQLGGGLTADDLMRLERHHAYVAPCTDGRVLPPVSLETRPLPASLHTAAEVRRLSRQRFGRDAGAVEAEIASRTNTPTRGPVGRRRRAS